MIRPESFIFRSIKYVTSLNRRKLKSNNGFYVSFRTIKSHDLDRWLKPNYSTLSYCSTIYKNSLLLTKVLHFDIAFNK